MEQFKLKQTNDNRWQITGTTGYRIVLDNKYDAMKHCEYLNKQVNNCDYLIEQNQEYYTALMKIKMVTEQIHQECGEIHVLELAIKIKNLIKEVMPQ